MGNKKKEDLSEYYTTTFSIPKWMAEKLKIEAEENGYRGMTKVVVIACTNHILTEEVRKKKNKKLLELLERGSITELEKEELWM